MWSPAALTELQHSGLGEIFDEQKVAERMEMGQVAGEVGMRAAGDLADQMGWQEGSREKVILHGVVGAGVAALGGGDALQGMTGAAANQALTVAMQDYLADNEVDPGSPLGRSLMELGGVAVGAAVGGASGAAAALYGEQFNRQLHLKEAEVLAEMVEDASEEEAERLCAAACALVACAQGVPADDPYYEELVGLQQAGASYLAEQEALKSTGLFTYTRTDAVNDWLLGHDEAITRLGGAARGVGGAAGAVGAIAGAVATSPACTTALGCAAPIGLGALAVASAQDGIEGVNQALGDYQSDQGLRVLRSFNPDTHMGEQNPLLELGLRGATLALEGILAKVGGSMLSRTQGGRVVPVDASQTPEAPPGITIRDHYDHHLSMVDDVKDQLAVQGYRVSDREISFGSSCGSGRCRPDIVAEAPDGTIVIIEIKTGGADLSIRQSEIFPQIRNGSSIPRGKVAEEFGLIPGIPLRDQGYLDGIPI